MFSYLRLIGCIWRWYVQHYSWWDVMRISLEPYNNVSRNHMAVRSRGAPDWWRDHTFMGWLGAGRRKTVLKRVADWSVSPFVCGTSIFVTSLAVTLECCVYLHCLLRLYYKMFQYLLLYSKWLKLRLKFSSTYPAFSIFSKYCTGTKITKWIQSNPIIWMYHLLF